MASYLRFRGQPSTPINVVAPSLSGSAIVGETLYGDAGSVSGYPTPSITLAWLRDTTAIATTLNYLVTSDDVGSTLTLQRTATNIAGSLITASAASATVVSASGSGPTLSTAPVLQGNIMVDHHIDLIPGVYAITASLYTPRVIRSYRLLRDDGAVAGMTDRVYVFTAGDLGHTFQWEETATDANGTIVTLTAATAAVTADNRTEITAAAAGLKNWQTTGTIAAATDQLEVVSLTGIEVGDPIIIEVGGEASTGLNTTGVGGTWPATKFATASDMTSSGVAINTWAGLLEDGYVYKKTGTTTWARQNSTNPYYGKTSAIAHRTTVSSIDTGTSTLTLAAACVAGATSANIYFDNEPRMNAIGNGFTSSVIKTSKKLVFGSGRWAFGNKVYMQLMSNLLVDGASDGSTEWYAPRGCIPLSTHWRGTGGDNYIRFINGVAHQTDTETVPIGTATGSPDSTANYAAMFIIESQSRGLIEDCTYKDMWQGISVSYGNDIYSRRCDGTHTGQLMYIQWHNQWSNTLGGGSYDNSQTNDRLMASCESFSSTYTEFHRFIGINANTSINAAGGWLYQDTDLTFDPQGTAPPYQALSGMPCQDCNSNISNTSGGHNSAKLELGGEFRNSTIRQLSPYAYNGQDFTMFAMILGPANVNVHVNGLKHFAPDYSAGVTNAPVSVIADSSDQSQSIISSFALYTPKPSPGSREHCFEFTQATGGVVAGCVADTIAAATSTDNLTRAAYVSGGGTLPT